MLKIKLSGKFDLSYRELILLEPDQKTTIWSRIIIFRKNPLDTRLRNHKLSGKLIGKWAFSITDDIRIVYEWKAKNMVRFLAVGRHEEVYGKK
jgi:mRNA-degrading endonuclease YafQ of YafQ-DinJ toxin-antitoxin module